MARTITRSLALGTTALLAAAALGAQPGQASGPTGSSAGLTSGAATSVNRALDRTDRAARAAVTGLAAHPREALRTKGQKFAARDAVLDRNGTSHVRLDRTYRGLPVIGGDLVVHQAGARWLGVSQTLTRPLSLSTTPKLAASKAVRKALAKSAATRSIAKLRKAGPARLVVETLSGRPRLAWQVTTVGKRADQTPSRLSTFVDARTGKVLRREEHVVNVDGTGNSLYSGTVPLQVTQSGSTYQLKDPTRGNTYTTDMNGKTDSVLCQYFGYGCSDRHADDEHLARRSATAPTATGPRPASTRSTAPTSPGTTTSTCTAATASSAPAPARTTGCTTAPATSTRSGTAPR